MTKEIIITPTDDGYYDDAGGFAWVKGLKQRSGLHLCKESFTNDYYRRGLDLQANRQQIMYRTSKFAGDIESYGEALEKLLNLFEKAMKFPLSKVSVAKRGYPYRANVILVDVSSKWTRYGPMIHLLALLIRNSRPSVPTDNWVKALTYLTTNTPRPSDKYQFQVAQNTIIELIKAKGVPKRVASTSNWDFEGGGSSLTILKGMGIVQYAERRQGTALYS